ncbi:LysM peptidoglycan-binding domain-containing protein [Nocardioides bruguierae]|uniref:LysM peptidoglycan-binding domain-containing protein n=1 Tax=Nocardioides bruguierae TaxID=2945102 RepID=A0A9X2DAR6_9ACTN|nr:LysM peptidoglycan-binding domain-containing protein [Nocardioides bruguierae]MCM0621947.1 LysM peptidoglycan-binding domain-containing protein [Nocardioides bruguierae]
MTATIALAALVVGVPLVLIVMVGNPWPANGAAAFQLATADSLIGLLASAAWLAWAQCLVCVVSEVAGVLRDVDPPRFGPDAQHRAVRALVYLVLLGGTAAGAVGPTAVAWADASSAAPAGGPKPAASPVASARAETNATPQARGSAMVTVAKGDTLWGLAEQHLGEGTRWREIAHANHDRVMADGEQFATAREIRPGWQLLLPTSAQQRDATSLRSEGMVRVETGDTLSSLAEDHLGDADEWPRLYRINRATVGPDPDVLEPGQMLRLERETGATSKTSTPPLTRAESDMHDGLTSTLPDPAGQFTATPAPEVSTDTDAAALPEDDVPVTAVTPWRAALATGSTLAAGLVVLVAAARRRQRVARAPGQVPRAVAPRLQVVERAIHEAGTAIADDTEFIDLALRSLSLSLRHTHQSLPEAGAVVLGQEVLELKLVGVTDQAPPPPWARGDDETWQLPRDAAIDRDATEHPAPYPALVSVGVDDSGRLWLIDLEVHGGGGTA